MFSFVIITLFASNAINSFHWSCSSTSNYYTRSFSRHSYKNWSINKTIERHDSTAVAETKSDHEEVELLKSSADCLMKHLKSELSNCRFADGVEIVACPDSSEREVLFSGIAAPGDELAFISIEEIVTDVQGKETSVGKAMQSYLSNNPDEFASVSKVLSSIYISIFLSLFDKEKKEMREEDLDPLKLRHLFYFNSLPSRKELSHIPVFWSSEEIGSLQNSELRTGIQERLRRWKFEYNIIYSAAQAYNLDFVDFDTYVWARSIICSRAFDLPVESGGVCLIPFIDMLNHHVETSISPFEMGVRNEESDLMIKTLVPARKCDWHLFEVGCFLNASFPKSDKEETALSADEKQWNGEGCPIPIEISYGTHSNEKFLINYGFSI